MLATPKKLNREVLIVVLGVLGLIRGLYELRHIAFIHEYLSTIVGIILVYAAVIHVERRKIPITFFERNVSECLRSLKIFFLTSLVIFIPFLLGNHFLQKTFLHHSLQIHWTSLTFASVLTQIILVAFPEEFFFRGYVQSFLRLRFPEKIKLLLPLKIEASWSIPLASLVFAAAHSFIAFQWWHFSIFFPALVFGWLRERTNGLVAPILFHALSNLVIGWINVSYR